MSRIIAVANAKGGVGKTTTAVNISAALAEAGYRVLAIDLDPQSSLTLSLGMNPLRVPGTICNLLSPGSDFLNAPIIHLQEQWDLIPANEELRALEHELDSDPKKIYTIGAGLHPFANVYDFIILDCAASMGVLTGAALAAADSVIIPLTPDFLAFQVSAILFRIIRRVQETINPNLQIAGIFLTMYDTRTKHAREILTHIRKTYGASVPFFSAVIYQSVKLKEAPSLGQSVLKYAPQSQAARAYRVVAREIVEGAPQPKRAVDKSKKNGAQNGALLASENGKAKPKAKPVETKPIETESKQPVAASALLAVEAPTIELTPAPAQAEPAPAVVEPTPAVVEPVAVIAETASAVSEPAPDALLQATTSPLPVFETHSDPPIDHNATEVIPAPEETAPIAETASVEKQAEATALDATALDTPADAEKAAQGANGFKGKLVHLVGRVRTAVPKPNSAASSEGVTGLFKKLRERGRQTNGNGQVTPVPSSELAALETNAIVPESPLALTASTEATVAFVETPAVESPVTAADSTAASPLVAEAIAVKASATPADSAKATVVAASEPTASEPASQVENPSAEPDSETVQAVAQEPLAIAQSEPAASEAATQIAIPPAELQTASVQAVAAEEAPQAETLTAEAEIPAAELINDEIIPATLEQATPVELAQIEITTIELVTEEPASRDDELDADGGEASATETDVNTAPVIAIETIVVEPTLALEPHDDEPQDDESDEDASLEDALPDAVFINEPQAEVVGPPFDLASDAADAPPDAPVAEPTLPTPPTAEPPRKLTPSEIWSLPYIPPSQREPATLSVVGEDMTLDDEHYVEEQEPTIQELLRRVAMLSSAASPEQTESESEEDEPDFEKLSQELFGAEADAYSTGELTAPFLPTDITSPTPEPAPQITSGLQLTDNPLVAYRASEIARDDVEAWIRRAESSEAPWEALAAWLHVLEINPLNGYARTRMEEMIRAWLEIAKRDEVDELIKLGNSLVRAGQRAPADETFRRVIELNPRAHRAWLGRALVTSNPLDRLVYVQRGLELAPGDPEVRRALADARDQLNAEANRLLEEGLHLAHSGRTAQAHLLFKHAIELAPLDDRAWLGCARTADNLPSKLSYLKQALQINPANTEAQDLYRILTNFMGTGKKERWAITPNDPRVIYFALGLLMLLAALVAIPLFIIH